MKKLMIAIIAVLGTGLATQAATLDIEKPIKKEIKKEKIRNCKADQLKRLPVKVHNPKHMKANHKHTKHQLRDVRVR
jgi:hypothetical protein